MYWKKYEQFYNCQSDMNVGKSTASQSELHIKNKKKTIYICTKQYGWQKLIMNYIIWNLEQNSHIQNSTLCRLSTCFNV